MQQGPNSIFETLDLSKTMVFKDGQLAKNYNDALLELTVAIGYPGGYLNAIQLEGIIKAAIVAQANALSNGIKDYGSLRTITAFHQWAMSIHNNNLGTPEGQAWPNNIVYDMIIALRNAKNLTSEDVLFHFFLEGLNARKMSKGETPSLDFISTSFILQVLSNIQPETPAARDFIAKYGSISAFIEPQKQLEAAMTNLKADPLFAFLSKDLSQDDKNIFFFSNIKNEEYGANAYDLELAQAKGVKRANEFATDNLSSDIQKMIIAIESTLASILPLFREAKSTPSARLLALWDASEWLCRPIVALKLAANLNRDFQPHVRQIHSDPILREIYERSMLGTFPGRARNNDLQRVEIKELFQQDAIAAEAKAKAKVRFSSS